MAKLGPCTVITRNKGGTASPRKIMNITQDRFTGDISHSVVWMRKFFSSRRKSFITGTYFVSINYSIYQRMYHVWTIIFPYRSREFPSKISSKIWLNVRRILLYSLIFFFVAAWRRVVANMKYANRNFVRLKNTCLGIFLKKRIKI